MVLTLLGCQNELLVEGSLRRRRLRPGRGVPGEVKVEYDLEESRQERSPGVMRMPVMPEKVTCEEKSVSTGRKAGSPLHAGRT